MRVRGKCSAGGAKLFTYSAATKIRGTLLAAGFFVGRGPATGPKLDTTAAYTTIEAAPHRSSLLGADWLDRWSRSESKIRDQTSAEERELIERLVTAHPQFTKKCQ